MLSSALTPGNDFEIPVSSRMGARSSLFIALVEGCDELAIGGVRTIVGGVGPLMEIKGCQHVRGHIR